MENFQMNVDTLNQIIGSLYTNLYASSKTISSLNDKIEELNKRLADMTLKYQLQTQRINSSQQVNNVVGPDSGQKDEVFQETKFNPTTT